MAVCLLLSWIGCWVAFTGSQFDSQTVRGLGCRSAALYCASQACVCWAVGEQLVQTTIDWYWNRCYDNAGGQTQYYADWASDTGSGVDLVFKKCTSRCRCLSCVAPHCRCCCAAGGA